MVLVNFWRYPDPYQRFLIRIRIRPNDTDPTGSGSETLIVRMKCNIDIMECKIESMEYKINSIEYKIIRMEFKIVWMENLDC